MRDPKSSYVAYLRDSGGDTQDLSTSEQALAVQRYCTERGYLLLTIYVDDATPGSSIVSRVQFKSMIQDLRDNKYPDCAGVLIWSYSRFSRDIDDAQYFKSDLRRRGYTIISLTDPVPEGSMGRLFEAAIDWKNAAFLENLSVDVRRGLYHLVETIGAVPGIPPRGFMRTPITMPHRRDGKPHIVHRWDPDPKWISQIQTAFEMRANGSSLAEIRRATNLYRTKSSWQHFFANPLYKGELRYGDLVISDYCEPVVPPQIWDAVQALTPVTPSTSDPKKHPRRQTSSYILSGNLYCAKCNSPMVGSATKSTVKNWRKRYYTCSLASRTHRAECNARLIPAEVIENWTITYLIDQVLNLPFMRQLADEALSGVDEQLSELTNQQSALTAALTENKRQRNAIADAIIAAGHTSTLLERLKALETDYASLTAQDTHLKNVIASLNQPITDEDIERLIKQLSPALSSGEPGLIRSVVQRLIDRMVVERTENGLEISIGLIIPTGQSHRRDLNP